MLSVLLPILFAPQEPLPQPAPAPAVHSQSIYLGKGIRFEASYQLVYRDSADPDDFHKTWCDNWCNGEKHLGHAACDTSCDTRCKELHEIVAYPGKSPLPNKVDGILRAKGLIQFEYLYARPLIDSGILAEPTKNAFYINRRLESWNNDPCSRSSKGFRMNNYTLRAKVKISEEVKVGEEMRVNVLMDDTVDAATVFLPSTVIWTSPTRVVCRCDVIQKIDEDGKVTIPDNRYPGETLKVGPPEFGGGGGGIGSWGVPGYGFNDWIKSFNAEDLKTPDVGLGFSPGADKRPTEFYRVAPGILDQLNVQVQLDDMNGGTLSAENPFDIPLWLYVGAGAWCDCRDDLDCQDCEVCNPSLLYLPPRALLSSGEPKKVSTPIKVMCLDIDKKEPTSSIPFKLRTATDPVRKQISKQITKAFAKGPWDQAKLWVYNDGATYGQIEKKLILPPTMGQFVKALYELAQAGVDFDRDKFGKVLEPRLLASKCASTEAVKWFIKRLVDKDGASLRSWAMGNGRSMSEMLGPNSKSDDVKHFALVANELASSYSTDGRGAALALMEEVPAEFRGKLAGESLGAVWLLCLDQDKDLAARALQLLDVWAPPEREGILQNIKASPGLTLRANSRH